MKLLSSFFALAVSNLTPFIHANYSRNNLANGTNKQAGIIGTYSR